jgi:hypothetical protein
MPYYMGDPGFLSFLGRGIKAIGGKLLGGGGGGFPGGGIGTVDRQPPVPSILMHQIQKLPGLRPTGSVGSVGLMPFTPGPNALAMARAHGAHYKPTKRHLAALAKGLSRARPRMNVTNVHALRRSLRRAQGFAKLAMKVIHITHPKKHGHFGGFKKGRRKKSV